MTKHIFDGRRTRPVLCESQDHYLLADYPLPVVVSKKAKLMVLYAASPVLDFTPMLDFHTEVKEEGHGNRS